MASRWSSATEEALLAAGWFTTGPGGVSGPGGGVVCWFPVGYVPAESLVITNLSLG